MYWFYANIEVGIGGSSGRMVANVSGTEKLQTSPPVGGVATAAAATAAVARSSTSVEK